MERRRKAAPNLPVSGHRRRSKWPLPLSPHAGDQSSNPDHPSNQPASLMVSQPRSLIHVPRCKEPQASRSSLPPHSLVSNPAQTSPRVTIPIKVSSRNKCGLRRSLRTHFSRTLYLEEGVPLLLFSRRQCDPNLCSRTSVCGKRTKAMRPHGD